MSTVKSELGRLLMPIPLQPLGADPLVSVMMSTYNRAEFLRGCVGSVARQTYSKWELLICDDGSCDGTWDVLQELAAADPRVKIVRKTNGGQASGFNAAYAMSKGEILCQLDSDDGYCPNKLERIVSTFLSHSDSGMVFHRVLRVEDGGKPIGRLPLSGTLPSGWCAPFQLENGGILTNLPPGGGIAVRREIAERMFPLEDNGSLRNFGDTPFLRLPPLMTNIQPIEECLAIYRRHKTNQSVLKNWKIYVERELNAYERLWQMQRAYLASISPQLPEYLSPLASSEHVVALRYMQARLSGSTEMGRRYEELIHGPTGANAPLVWRVMWRIAPLLPTAVFLRIFTVLVNPSRIKQWLWSSLQLLLRIARWSISSIRFDGGEAHE